VRCWLFLAPAGPLEARSRHDQHREGSSIVVVAVRVCSRRRGLLADPPLTNVRLPLLPPGIQPVGRDGLLGARRVQSAVRSLSIVGLHRLRHTGSAGRSNRVGHQDLHRWRQRCWRQLSGALHRRELHHTWNYIFRLHYSHHSHHSTLFYGYWFHFSGDNGIQFIYYLDNANKSNSYQIFCCLLSPHGCHL